MTRDSLLLCVSGQIGSGKPSVSEAVASALGWECVAFGNFLRGEIAQLGGDPTSREALQELGQKRVDEDPVGFCRDVFGSSGFRPGDNLVVDGIRHLEVIEVLTVVAAPSQARLLYLKASETTRLAHVKLRSDKGNFSRADSHRVEADLRNRLPGRADGIVDAGQPFHKVVADCLQFAERWRAQ